MGEAYIYDAVRTCRGKGKASGALHPITPVHLLTNVFQAMEGRLDLDTAAVDDVVLGCVTAVGEQGADIARTAVLASGWDQSVPGVTLNRFCGSGLEAINLAAMKVMSGQEDMVVAGGVEHMSRWPMGSDGGAMVMDPRVNNEMMFVPQGVSADLIATIEGKNRRDVDEFAAWSQAKAATAEAEGRFTSRIPVTDVNGSIVLDHDELPRAGTTADDLADLRPSFEMMGNMGFDSTALRRYPNVEEIMHVHHAGNSSGIVDGAAAVLLGSKAKGEAMGLRPRARIVATCCVGSEPTIMLTGPGPASEKALKKAGMNASDIDLYEINEAFAIVPMRTMRELNIPEDKVNVNGGSIALGHPLGATGAMLMGTAVDELERSGKSTALITLCIGGGMGIATIIERV